MDIKSYFQGKKAGVFWGNVALMAAVLILAPVITLFYIDHYTHHGERVEVPSVDKMSVDDAEAALAEYGLVAIVTDSVNKMAGYAPGSVYSQMPKAGSEVKDGRMVYLTVVRTTDVLISFPDVAGNMSEVEARQTLKNLGFRFTPNREVESEMKGMVLNVYQGSKKLTAGMNVSSDLPLTLYVGIGYEEEDEDMELDGLSDADTQD